MAKEDLPINILCHVLRNGFSRLEYLIRERMKLELESRKTMQEMESALSKYCDSVRGMDEQTH